MVLVIDNYDSFTWNLVQFLGELGADPRVIRNDDMTAEAVMALNPSRVVLSPGPRTPGEAGVSVEVVRSLPSQVPLLGVCLGHQAIGEAYGGRTIRATRVMHGKTDRITHTREGIFAGLPSPLQVTRYHSLVTDPACLPEALVPSAWSTDPRSSGEVQAMRHATRPVWGVQFHPESLFSSGGMDLLRNFLAL